MGEEQLAVDTLAAGGRGEDRSGLGGQQAADSEALGRGGEIPVANDAVCAGGYQKRRAVLRDSAHDGTNRASV